jgi:Polysaccharide biosynthesis protein
MDIELVVITVAESVPVAFGQGARPTEPANQTLPSMAITRGLRLSLGMGASWRSGSQQGNLGGAASTPVGPAKAANPISVLGYSKRAAELITAQIASTAAGSYMSVRFGNVLGSRGPFIHAFRAQIENGEPVTVTDRDVTRYFMTIPEAVQLVPRKRNHVRLGAP